MNKLRLSDLHLVVSRIPKDVAALLKTRNVFLGGGFIRETIAGGEPVDIDLFGDNSKTLLAIAEALTKDRVGARLHTTQNALTVLSPSRLPVQFITRWTFGTAVELVPSFDFTVCQAAVYWDREQGSWMSIVHDDFYADLAARRLVYTFPERAEDAGGSLLRAIKFVKRGYNIQAGSLAGVMARVAMAVDFERLKTKHEATSPDQSLEKSVAWVMTGVLREVDPLNVIDGVDLLEEAPFEVAELNDMGG